MSDKCFMCSSAISAIASWWNCSFSYFFFPGKPWWRSLVSLLFMNQPFIFRSHRSSFISLHPQLSKSFTSTPPAIFPAKIYFIRMALPSGHLLKATPRSHLSSTFLFIPYHPYPPIQSSSILLSPTSTPSQAIATHHIWGRLTFAGQCPK